MIRVERVKNSKGMYEFGCWFYVSTDDYISINIGIAFIKSLHFVIYWE